MSPKKGKFAHHLGRFDKQSINEFLSGVLRGRIPLADIPELPAVTEVDCEAIHAAATEVVAEEDFDLDDILSYVHSLTHV